MRYGMNPHQSASIVAGHGPRVVNGEPSMINYLDALHPFELVREADDDVAESAAAHGIAHVQTGLQLFHH
jgi:phosphoribosylaminoimidazolecarboxamide formyltransferase/IMP cyclohydrolase